MNGIGSLLVVGLLASGSYAQEPEGLDVAAYPSIQAAIDANPGKMLFVRRAPAKGSLIAQSAWDAGYVNNWHQGSALVVTSPEETAQWFARASGLAAPRMTCLCKQTNARQPRLSSHSLNPVKV